MRPRTRRAPAAVVTLVVAAALIASCGSDDRGSRADSPARDAPSDTAPVQNMVPDPPIVVGGLGLTDVSARPPRELGFHADPGHLLIVYFGYTNCPDVCPPALADLRAALDLLAPGDRNRVRVAMATVDPERDTAEVMSRYVGHFFDDGHALRTDDPALQHAVEAAFGVRVARKAPDRHGDYAVDHTSALFPVDAGGHVQFMWLTGMEPQEIARAIRSLLRRVADPAHVSGVVVSGASVSPPAAGSAGATVSLTLHNAGTGADELVGARVAVEVAGRTELAAPVALAPHADARVGPGGTGLVLADLQEALVPGQRVPVELTFRRSAPQTVMAPVAG